MNKILLPFKAIFSFPLTSVKSGYHLVSARRVWLHSHRLRTSLQTPCTSGAQTFGPVAQRRCPDPVHGTDGALHARIKPRCLAPPFLPTPCMLGLGPGGPGTILSHWDWAPGVPALPLPAPVHQDRALQAWHDPLPDPYNGSGLWGLALPWPTLHTGTGHPSQHTGPRLHMGLKIWQQGSGTTAPSLPKFLDLWWAPQAGWYGAVEWIWFVGWGLSTLAIHHPASHIIPKRCATSVMYNEYRPLYLFMHVFAASHISKEIFLIHLIYQRIFSDLDLVVLTPIFTSAFCHYCPSTFFL